MYDTSLADRSWVQHLKTQVYGRNTAEYFEIIDSTNEACCRMGFAGAPDGSLCIAEEQTNGRGRLNRKWYAGKGTSLLCSVIIRPRVFRDLFLYTFSAALSMRAAVLDTCGAECGIKWPNDLVIERKKICGILSTCSWKDGKPDFIVVGSGLNVYADKYPEDSVFDPICIENICGGVCDRGTILAAYLNELEKRVRLCDNGNTDAIFNEYRAYCITVGSEVEVSGNVSFSGTATAVCDDGTLLIRLKDGKETHVNYGDVSIRTGNKYV